METQCILLMGLDCVAYLYCIKQSCLALKDMSAKLYIACRMFVKVQLHSSIINVRILCTSLSDVVLWWRQSAAIFDNSW